MDIMITGGHARDGVDCKRIAGFALPEDFVGLNMTHSPMFQKVESG